MTNKELFKGRIGGGGIGGSGIFGGIGVGSGVLCDSKDNSYYCSFIKIVTVITYILSLILIFYFVYIIFLQRYFTFSNVKTIKPKWENWNHLLQQHNTHTNNKYKTTNMKLILNSTSVLINDCVITVLTDGMIVIRPLDIYTKQGIDCSDIPRKTYGSKQEDDLRIQQFVYGEIKYSDL